MKKTIFFYLNLFTNPVNMDSILWNHSKVKEDILLRKELILKNIALISNVIFIEKKN